MHGIGLDAHDARLEEGGNLASLDAIFDVRAHPILDGGAQLRAAMHQRNASAVAIEIQSGFRGGIFSADDHDVLPPEGMRLGVVVRDVRQVFAGCAEAIGQVVVSGGHDQLARGVDFFMRQKRRDSHALLALDNWIIVRGAGAGVHAKISVAALNAGDRFAQTQLEVVVLHAFAVILERFDARGLFRRAHEGQIADLEQFRRGEENHVHRVAVERIAQHAFINDQRPKTRALGLNRAGQAGGTGANADHVVRRIHLLNVPTLSAKIQCARPRG